jgi:hypothetical protein
VTGWVGVDVCAVELYGAEGQDVRPGCGDVFDHDVEVNLLRNSWVWPAGRTVVGGELEGEPGRGLIGRHHDPVVAAIRDGQTEQPGVERGQGCRVRAVKDHVVQTADHNFGAGTVNVPSSSIAMRHYFLAE